MKRPVYQKRPPIRDREYLEYIRGLPCAVCGQHGPCVAHHVETGGMGIKTDDLKCIPVHELICHQKADRERPAMWQYRKALDLLCDYLRAL